MPSKNRNGLPAYQRIQSDLRERIESGELRSGDVVASERDLARIHQVSLMTARHALTSLERESLFVFLERKYKVDIGHADEEIDATAADRRIANLLGIPCREPLLRIRQVIYSTSLTFRVIATRHPAKAENIKPGAAPRPVGRERPA